jgi:O-antigen/teichoic acid export membrane protein
MWRDLARLGSGAGIGQLAILAVTPLLTRLYSPEHFGQLGLLLAFSSVALVFVGLRYDVAIASAPELRDADALAALSIGAILPTAVVAAGVLAAISANDVLGFGALPPLVAVAAVPYLALAAVVMTFRYWHVRRQSFSVIGTAIALQGCGRAVVPIFASPVIPGFWGLFAGEIAGRLLGIRRLARDAWGAVKQVDADSLRAAAKANWRYPAIVLPSALVDAMAVALPLPLVALFYGDSVAGQFALVQRVASGPSALIASSFADVVHGRATEAIGRGAPLTPVFAAASKRLLLLSIAIYLPLALLGPMFAETVFGKSWQAAGVLLATLSPALAISLVVSPLSRLVLVTGKLHYKLIADAFCLVLPAASLWVMRDQSSHVAFIALSAATFLSNLVYLALVWCAVRAHQGSRG